MLGRFLISKSTEEQFYFNLLSRDGERILTSELFAAKQAVHAGIASVKMNAAFDQQYDRRIDVRGMSYFVLLGKHGEIVGKSQPYSSTTAMENGIQSVKMNAPSAVTEDDGRPPQRLPLEMRFPLAAGDGLSINLSENAALDVLMLRTFAFDEGVRESVGEAFVSPTSLV